MGESVDLFIIGGGINGCGIARDAAGRGLSVALAEMGDLGSGASGNTTKLVHGGLRYIERLQFRRLREAMAERDILLRMAPHAVRPLRVVLPYDPDLRLEADTPAARLLSVLLPWSGGRRPAWAISLALSLYGPRGPKLLPPKADLDLRGTAEGLPLQERFAQGWEVSDAVVDDARLVMLNARDAAQRGARIMTRRLVTSARRDGDHWAVVVEDLQGKQSEYIARALVNAAGPWAGKVQASAEGVVETVAPGLVRGSHAVVPALFGHDKGYYLQAKDGRYIFALPFGRNHTLIGTTYVAHPDADAPAVGTLEEQLDEVTFFENGDPCFVGVRVDDDFPGHAASRPRSACPQRHWPRRRRPRRRRARQTAAAPERRASRRVAGGAPRGRRGSAGRRGGGPARTPPGTRARAPRG